jgi:hypothetical protein
MRTHWTISTRGLAALVAGLVALVILIPVGAQAFDSSAVFITDSTGTTAVDVSGSGELFVTASEKNPLPVQGTVGVIPVPNQPQLLRETAVSSGGNPTVFFGSFAPEEQVAITSATFANELGTNANITVFGWEISGSNCNTSLPSHLGPSLMVASVTPHDTVVVALPQPIIAPKRNFTGNWCLGASLFNSGGSSEILATIEGYRL